MWALKKDEFSDYTKKFLVDILNFELVLLIANILLALVPVVRWFAGAVIFVINLVIALRCFSATKDQKEYSFPINISLIK